MKKYFYSLLAATGLLMATSCSQDDLANEIGSESKMVTFKVNVPEQAASRSVGEGANATALIFAMYEEGSDEVVIANTYEGDTDNDQNISRNEDGSFEVKVPMAKDITYDLLFLAYNPRNCAFDIDSNPERTNLKALTFKDKLTANLDAYDAFVGVKKGQGISDDNTVTLKRPFAQVNAATSQQDLDNAESLKSTVTKSEFRIYGVPSTYNVFEEEATGTMDVVFEKSAIPYNENLGEYKYLALAYVLAGETEISEQGTYIAEFLFYREDGKQVSSLHFDNFPIRRNYRTNVLGNLLTKVEDYTVTILPGFTEPAHSADPDKANSVYTVTDSEGWEEVAAILASPGKDTISVKLDAGMARSTSNTIDIVDIETSIHEDKTVFLDLNGYTLSQTKECSASYQMINNKGTLTIVDSSEGATGKISFKDTGAGDPSFGWGSYTIRNEGTLVVEDGTIEHLGEQNPGNGQPNVHMYCAIFQYSGSTTINGGTISTPTYRSVRLWKGDMSINGGEFDGQVWVQAVDNTSELTINGGKFTPNGNDGSSVFVENKTYEVAFSVTGGEFATKIGCSNVSKLAKTVTGGTFNDASVLNYLADGADIKFGSNVEAPENTTFVVSSGMTVSIDLNEHVLSSTNNRTETHNFFIDVNGGTLNMKNGTIEYQHNGTNMGWNGAATVIDITAGGVLNLNDMVVNNLGGTDMNFAVHMNNWGEVTLNADNCEFLATYCGVRVFNSGFDMNNVTIKNSKLTGATRAFWVHNYIGDLDSSKHSDEAINERLKLDIYNNNNIFEISGEALSPIRYGFATAIYFDENGNRIVDSKDALTEALANGQSVKLSNNVEFGNVLTIDKPVTIDLNGKELNTTNGYGGIILKNGASIKNGTINHTGNIAAIKAYQVESIENVTINVTPTDGKIKGGIVIQSGADTYIGSLKDVIITGTTNGIETYLCGNYNREKPVIGYMENVNINATDTGILLSAPIGTAKNCSIKGTKYGINMQLKGEYNVSITLEDCDVIGTTASIWGHDEKGISNTTNCSLNLTYDAATVLDGPFIWDFEDECLGVVTLNKPE